MEENRIPSVLLHILFNEVNERMGRRSLIMLLRRSGLFEYVDRLVPKDESPSITVSQFSRLLANMYDVFGAHDAQVILQQSGRLRAAELRRRHPRQFTIGGTAVRLLSSTKRMSFILEKLVEQGAESYGASCHLEEEEDAFVLSVGVCPHCADIAQRGGEKTSPITKPVCYIPASVLDEMVEWVTGERHLVREVECIAQGAEACRYWIGK